MLAVVLRIAAAAAVTEADVEVPVRPEGDGPTIVIRERLVDGQDRRRRARIEPVRVGTAGSGLAGFGEDEAGELYAANLDGTISRVVTIAR